MNKLYVFIFMLSGYALIAQTHQINKTKIADSLELEGEYEKALEFRTEALAENGQISSQSKFLLAKWNYTQSCILENKGGQENHQKALAHSLKAKKLCLQNNPKKNLYFQYLVSNRVYHQYGYLGEWANALKEAKLDLEILLDTVPEYHLKALYIMDDLGFLYTRTGDPERANQYYERSHELYKKYHPNEIQEIYVNYDRMAENYKNLGLRHEEYRLLSELERYWENNSESPEAFYHKFITYKKLAEWYTFYGNYELSENYLKKEEQLFDSVSKSHKKTEQKALDRRDLWKLYLNYAHLYQNMNSNKNGDYINKARQLLKESNRYYSWDVLGEINLYALEANLPNQTLQTSINRLQLAINLASEYQTIHYTDPVPYQIQLFEILKKNKKYEDALQTLDMILNHPNLNDNQRFRLNCHKGMLLSQQSKIQESKAVFEKAQGYILKQKKGDGFSSISIDEIREFYNYDTLEGLLLLGDFMLDYHKHTKSQNYLSEALQIFLLCSEVFNKIYIGDQYNKRLNNFYKSIESGLVSCIEIKPSNQVIDKCIQALEKNASKLAWTKFIYNTHKNRLKVPDSVLNIELKLKTLLNYYQTALYSTKKENGLSGDSIKMRIVDLNKKLRDHQEFVHGKYIKYYNRSEGNFNIEELKKSLKDNESVLKFSFVKNNLYAYILSKERSALIKMGDSKDIQKEIVTYVRSLSKFNSEIKIPDALKPIGNLMAGLNNEHLTIAPSETLNFIPFETLIPNYCNTDIVINYSASLSLYNEQKKTNIKKRPLNVGIFTGQNDTSSQNDDFLPSVSNEVSDISNECNSTVFLKATKEIFIDKAGNHNVLHLAMHSNIDSENPELSNLHFYDGELLIGELYNESLTSDLVVLSACNTGNGVLFVGDGVQSVSNAFTYAGVPSSVMSLWKVDDKSSAMLMASFYKHLNMGKPKDLALKLAKKDYMDSDLDTELKHPYYWAGFIVSGNTEPFSPSKNSNLWWLTLLVLPLGILYYYGRSKSTA